MRRVPRRSSSGSPRAQLRQLGPEHVQTADRSAARAAGLAVCGDARDAAERAERHGDGCREDARGCSATATSRRPRSRPRGVARGSCSGRSSPAASWSSCREPRKAPKCASTSTCRTTSMDQTLSCISLETLTLVDPGRRTTRSTCSRWWSRSSRTPELILRKQLDRIKDRAVAQMKADGVEYEQRMEELGEARIPAAARLRLRDVQRLRRSASVGRRREHPPSRSHARCSRTSARLRRRARLRAAAVRGLLLRHLNSVYKVPSQTVPDGEDR